MDSCLEIEIIPKHDFLKLPYIFSLFEFPNEENCSSWNWEINAI